MNPRVLSLIAVISLFAVSVPVAEAGPTTERALAITTGSANPTEPFGLFDSNPIKLYDLNGDGRKEIIAQNDNQWVYVFDSKDGRLLAEVKTAFPSGWGARSFNGPEASIMEEGGTVRLVIANSAAVITMYRFDGVGSNGKFILTKEWDRRLNDCFSGAGMDARPTLADITGDGRLEIIGVTEENGVYALRRDGSLLWKQCTGGGNGAASVADLDLDGIRDVVHVSDGGLVVALRGQNGAWMWSYNVRSNFDLGAASIPVSAGIGQLDGRGGPDVVIGARDSHNPDDWSQNHALLLALDSGGKKLWSRQDPNGNPLTYTRPVIVDADGNGVNEVYWADWNTVGHKPPFEGDDPGPWAVTGPANFYRISNTGGQVWKQTLGSWWNNKDVPIAEVTGDGVQDMLANGPLNGHDGIWYLDTRSGAKQQFVDTYPWKVNRAPVVENLWGQGTTQWVVGGAPITSSAGGHAILVYDAKTTYNAKWPHVPYPAFGGGSTTPPPPPPPSGETFAATFRIKSPNAWWQELYVEPDDPRTISNAEIRINGGDWKPMTKKSWGAWATSHHTPAGTQVEFRATDSGGGVSVSEPFTWLDGDLDKRSTGSSGGDTPPPPPPSGDAFDATFRIKSPNAWWQELYVEPDDPRTISNAEIRINGGDWKPMTKKSWGAWATSHHTPAGTKIEFRATDNGGAVSVSEPFTWLDGDLDKRSTGSSGSTPPPDSTFDADFRLSSSVNNWWVEVYVDSSHTVTAVDARVGSGEWKPLTKRDWGSWAASFHIPSGAQVTFRATDSAGATDTSSAFTWP